LQFLSVRCEELSPVKDEESSLEGSTVTLSYRFSREAKSSDYFFWYRQYPGKPPEFLIYHLSSGKVMKQEISGLSVTVKIRDRDRAAVEAQNYWIG
uniref:Immunoglobulin V-set domain-containing protein n=1 Tax=Oreochromis aureus TaxID=47969 RepID=A0AAZ1X784_OREAU